MKSILLVDDSATVLLSTSSILTKSGYEVAKAASGMEALGLLKGGLMPNLVITDLNMPGMNGIDFIKALRALPTHKFVPILFLTTESQQVKRAEAKAAGASGWLVKPVTADELLSTIRLVIK
ncbi:MAG: two-component system sensor histidine kinase/response regulator [Candidatus Dactylopiibacterium carminicum]|uniref:Response regulator n=1 Tax=Candidatus Dactylopiibacterium carminicum TaxID=857335 RepID=A0A272EN25_9RHOO|nr:response regulator [Candidatus Dactylopiibacterium carminicum]KAF7597951.1 response regulator [Candidatus Dactylopiibacterium carminicum]PAS91524.1 MAG: two-component system sensor histidine kinase/response regulator [Candidatus Dactylopiibacterium carminicum]PAS93112.1 MAG: two-component system sensor histidine kinase/response regulator [Candidatus Dactylopiibacterium carminicum]PAS96102.1 MAG: two-component system sensor histidine kinase/response regulator [Candidatus Dactylopiibacterium c